MENGKTFQIFEKYMMTPLTKLSQLKFIQAVASAGIASTPFSIIGSIFLILNILPTTIPALQNVFNTVLAPISNLYMVANYATVGSLSLYFVLAIGYNYTKLLAKEDGTNISPMEGALISLFSFLLVVPELQYVKGQFSLIHTISEAGNTINGWTIGTGPERFAASGVFTAILMAGFSVRIYHICLKKNWSFTMPEGVPQGVARAFSALIPTAIVSISVLFINGSLIMLGKDVFKIIAVPFSFATNIANTWWGLLIIYLLIHGLWVVGIHGGAIFASFLAPISVFNMQANIDGGHFVYAGAYQNSFVTIGGSGATLLLVIMMVFMAKSGQLKLIGKASIIPGIFNINEPLIFGTPIIYNPYLAIPFMIAPSVSALISYFAISTGIVMPVIADVPWPLPMGIQAFMATGGDWKAVILAIITTIVSGLIYLPFFKMYDKKLYNEEKRRSESTKETPMVA